MVEGQTKPRSRLTNRAVKASKKVSWPHPDPVKRESPRTRLSKTSSGRATDATKAQHGPVCVAPSLGKGPGTARRRSGSGTRGRRRPTPRSLTRSRSGNGPSLDQRVQNGEPAPTNRNPEARLGGGEYGCKAVARGVASDDQPSGQTLHPDHADVVLLECLRHRRSGMRTSRAKIGRRALAGPCRRATVTREHITAKRPKSSRASRKLGRRIRAEAAIASRSAYYYNEEGKGRKQEGKT